MVCCNEDCYQGRECPVRLYQSLMNSIKEHLIPYPQSADARLWNERLGYLIEDVVNFYESNNLSKN